MRALLTCALAATLAVALAACGSSHSGQSPDAPGSHGGDAGAVGDGSGSNPDGSTSGPRDVTLTLTNRPNNPAMFSFLVAYEDGAGPWKLAPAPSGDTYTFSINAPVYSFAWTCASGTGAGGTGPGTLPVNQVTIGSFAVAEKSSVTMEVPARCTDRLAPAQLSGTISNLPFQTFALVSWGNRQAFVNPNNGGYYSMPVGAGTHDLFVYTITNTGGLGGNTEATAVAVMRGVAVTGQTDQDVDFSTAQPVQSFPVTIVTGGAGLRANATTTLYAHGSSPTLVSDNANPYTTAALDASQQLGGDIYDQSIVVAAAGSRATTETWTATPAARSWSAPAALGGTLSTVPTSTPYPEIKTTWSAYADAVGYAWTATQTQSATQCGNMFGCSLVWAAVLSPGVTGAMPAFQMPDLSALAGWDPKFQFVSGSNVATTVSAMTSSAGAADFPPATPAATGTSRSYARADGTVTP